MSKKNHPKPGSAPASADAVLKALARHQSGDLSGAERGYREVLSKDSVQFEALHYLGMLEAQGGRLEEALGHLSEALQVNPQSLEAHLSHANVMKALNRPEEALGSCERALAVKPDFALGHYTRGNLLMELGRLEEALASYDRVVNLIPGNAEVFYNRGLALQMLKRYAESLASYERALTLAPDDADVLTNHGIVLYELKRYDEALASYDRALKINPDFAEALNNRANVLLELKRPQEALASCEQALAIRPDYAGALNNRGSALYQLKRYEEALASCDRALALEPDFGEALNNRGSALRELKRPEEAQKSCEQALTIAPDFADAHYNLANALRDQSRLDEAVASYRRALALSPDHVEAHNNLGSALQDQDSLDEAIASFRKAIAIKPSHVEAHNNLGYALKKLGRLDEAAASFRTALEIKPDFAEAHSNLGTVLQAQGNLDEAVASYRAALLIKPESAIAHYNLGCALCLQDKWDEAYSSLHTALTIDPDYAEAHCNAGAARMGQGRPDEALASYRKALSLKSDDPSTYGNLLFLYAHQDSLEPQSYLAEARGWEQACIPEHDRQAARARVFQRLPLTGRRLKVGYVSGDYRQHAVSYFIEQLFKHHDRARIELFAYSTFGQRDEVTVRFESLAEHWVSLVGLSDAVILERIAADGIDVLIDLSGHTDHNRLGVFARRAAPVQAYYLGYFASTGLTEMDYWIGDAVVTPPATDAHFSEQVWRLPRTCVSYSGKTDASEADWCPAVDGTVWVGSFNNLNKLTPATLALWAKVLHALPEGRLLLKTKQLADAGNRRRILDSLTAHGIALNRVELQDGSSTPGRVEHMNYYNRLDIALDPIGGHGGVTTTCDALWMAVPVVTLMGGRVTSRMTASIVNALGHPEWITHSEADYIEKVVALARDVDLRKELRGTQRIRMEQSPLCDAHDLAVKLESAYVEMYERWYSKQISTGKLQ